MKFRIMTRPKEREKTWNIYMKTLTIKVGTTHINYWIFKWGMDERRRNVASSDSRGVLGNDLNRGTMPNAIDRG